MTLNRALVDWQQGQRYKGFFTMTTLAITNTAINFEFVKKVMGEINSLCEEVNVTVNSLGDVNVAARMVKEYCMTKHVLLRIEHEELYDVCASLDDLFIVNMNREAHLLYVVGDHFRCDDETIELIEERIHKGTVLYMGNVKVYTKEGSSLCEYVLSNTLSCKEEAAAIINDFVGSKPAIVKINDLEVVNGFRGCSHAVISNNRIFFNLDVEVSTVLGSRECYKYDTVCGRINLVRVTDNNNELVHYKVDFSSAMDFYCPDDICLLQEVKEMSHDIVVGEYGVTFTYGAEAKYYFQSCSNEKKVIASETPCANFQEDDDLPF